MTKFCASWYIVKSKFYIPVYRILKANIFTLTASDIFLVFCITIKYFLILQSINKKISINWLILRNSRTPPGGV